ncbi:Hint domain-containing protein [Streptomyces sp. NPDC058301]|uniref:Hint domain-containing protein n=1 Tax=Streptomyces sp. NPDC058301 TaxID=3346436 RepID=UPI0036EB8A70
MVVGIAAGAACTALTAGVGAVACAAAAGAVANAVGYAMSDGPHTLSGYLGAAAVGGLTGLAGGGAGALAGRALASSGASALARGALTGAAAGGAEGAVSYGVSCSSSPGGCSVSGAAKATTGGAALGGLFGAAASKFGRKGCTPHSFTATTPVVLASGAVKPISEIKVGDWVLTAEPGSKKKEKHQVKAVVVTKTDRDYVDVAVATTSGAKAIQTTAHHQFYDATANSWIQAKDLKAHHKLQDAAGGNPEIANVTAYQAHRTTYDLSIEGLHTYYVKAGSTPVLVHNYNVVGVPCGDETPLGNDVPIRKQASVGNANGNHDYRQTFYDANPGTQGNVVVHHAIEQQVLRRYPGLFTPDEVHSVENLRGIPKGYVNNRVHLSAIRNMWNDFYNSNPNPTRQQVLGHVTHIDDQVGQWFNPRVR